MHLANRLESLDDVRVLLRIGLMCHTLIAFTGRPRLVRVDPWDEHQLVAYRFLQLRHTPNVLTHRVLIVRRTRSDDQHHPIALVLENLPQFFVTGDLDRSQILPHRISFPDRFWQGGLTDQFECHRLLRFFPDVFLLESSSLVDNLPENALDRLVAQGPLVERLQLTQHGCFPFGRVDGLAVGPFDLTHFERAPSPLAQEFDQLPVDFVDFLSPVLEVHPFIL